MRFTVTVAGRTYEIEVDHDRLVRVNGQPMYVNLEQVGSLPVYTVALDDAAYVVFVEESQGTYRVEVAGSVYPTQVQLLRPTLLPREIGCSQGKNGCMVVTAPLAGRLVSLPVAVGDRVQAGQIVAVVESMKMQMELKASRPGLVSAVHGPPGRDVAQEERLVTLQRD